MVANFLRKVLDDMDGPQLFFRPMDKFKRGYSCEGVNEGGNATHAVPGLFKLVALLSTEVIKGNVPHRLTLQLLNAYAAIRTTR